SVFFISIRPHPLSPLFPYTTLFRSVRGGGCDVEQRARGASGAAAGYLPSDGFVPVDSRTHERPQLDVCEDTLARAVYDADRDASTVDGGQYADVGTGGVAR